MTQANAPSPDVRSRRTVFSSAVLLLALLILALALRPIWQPLLFAALVAATLVPVQEWLTRVLRQHRYLAAGIMTVAVMGLIVTPIAVITVIGVQQALEVAADIRDAAARGELHELLRPLPDWLERWLRPALERVPAELKSLERGSGAPAGRWAAEYLQATVATVSTFAFDLAMMVIALFFLIADGHRLIEWLEKFLPLGKPRTRELLEEFRSVSRTVIGANVATGAAQATAATIGYLLAKVPQPLFFGLLTLLTSFIPSVGTAIISVPLVLLLYLLGHPMAALFLLAWSTVVVALIDNFLRPLLIKDELHAHGALIFFLIIGGIGIFGVAGLVVGPLALALFLTMMRFHARDHRNSAGTDSGG